MVTDDSHIEDYRCVRCGEEPEADPDDVLVCVHRCRYLPEHELRMDFDDWLRFNAARWALLEMEVARGDE